MDSPRTFAAIAARSIFSLGSPPIFTNPRLVGEDKGYLIVGCSTYQVTKLLARVPLSGVAIFIGGV